MMQVTDKAMETLRDILDRSEHQSGDVIRLVSQRDDLGLQVTHPEDGDLVFEHDGAPVFATTADLAERLDRHTIDIDETADGLRFILADSEEMED